jgi:hypothetical protein
MIVESIIGTLLGGVLRLIPEWMGMKDKNAERRHELNLLKAEGELARQNANFALKQEDVKVDGKYLDALVAASQAQATKTGIAWVDALSASVRPILTYWWVVLYSLVKLAFLSVALTSNIPWDQALISIWSEQDWAIVSAIIGFWFVSRSVDKKKS